MDAPALAPRSAVTKTRPFGSKPCGDRIPPVSDPRWPDWAEPLRCFLTTGPQTWVELLAWGKKQGLSQDWLRHLLCWMRLHRLAEGEPLEPGSTTWVWFATTPRPREAPDVTPESRRCTCPASAGEGTCVLCGRPHATRRT